MIPINFTFIIDASPRMVKERLWKVLCTFPDDSRVFYPTPYGTKHAAMRQAAVLLEAAEEARNHGE